MCGVEQFEDKLDLMEGETAFIKQSIKTLKFKNMQLSSRIKQKMMLKLDKAEQKNVKLQKMMIRIEKKAYYLC